MQAILTEQMRVQEPTTSSPPEALHHAPPAAAVHEQLPQSPVEDQNSHHLLLSGRQAEAAPLQTDPSADSLRSPPGALSGGVCAMHPACL